MRVKGIISWLTWFQYLAIQVESFIPEKEDHGTEGWISVQGCNVLCPRMWKALGLYRGQWLTRSRYLLKGARPHKWNPTLLLPLPANHKHKPRLVQNIRRYKRSAKTQFLLFFLLSRNPGYYEDTRGGVRYGLVGDSEVNIIIVNIKLEYIEVIYIILRSAVVLIFFDPKGQMTDSEMSADNKDPPTSFPF